MFIVSVIWIDGIGVAFDSFVLACLNQNGAGNFD